MFSHMGFQEHRITGFIKNIFYIEMKFYNEDGVVTNFGKTILQLRSVQRAAEGCSEIFSYERQSKEQFCIETANKLKYRTYFLNMELVL
jgi:hypothetical protein